MEGLRGLVDGDHYLDTFAEDAIFESRYHFPGWPATIRGRANLIATLSGYGKTIRLHSGDALVVHHSQDGRVVILEYEVHGQDSFHRRRLRQQAHFRHHNREEKDRALERLHGLSGGMDGAQ